MKTLFFVATFLLMTTLSYGQYECKLIVTNMTGAPIISGAQLTEGTPNVCPVPLIGTAEAPVIPNGETYELVIATVPDGDPIVSPYIIGAAFTDGTSASWRVNDCWNIHPGCTGNAGPLNIVVTSCGSNNTYVTVY